MAHKTIEPDSSGTRAVRVVARHFLRKADRCLAAPHLTDLAVHDARKELKKSRAAVRLLREAMGESDYQRENALLRDAAHTLNTARDAKVLVQTLASLRRRHRKLQQDRLVAQLERALRDEQSAAQRHLRARANGLESAQRALEEVTHRANHWAVGKDGWSSLGPALKRIYRSGRRAVPTAHGQSADADLHEWRKQLKYWRYALQILQPMQPQILSALAKQAQQLTDRLGEAHDLALLAEKARVFAQRSGESDPQTLVDLIERRRERLASNALMEGEWLYRLTPRELERQFGRYWRQWRRTAS